ncbi:MAG: protoglobin domain-containing protein [Halieaceae bacterium]|jgi:hypothetical protein|nr:protoglobin domain-containing protein [Halieaceae bacterium]
MATLTATLVLLALPAAAAGEKPAGYRLGDKTLSTAPYTPADLELLKKTVLFTQEDEKWLRASRKVLEPQAEAILDIWYGFVGSTPHLLYYFQNQRGKPDAQYLGRVRARFRQWILDTADANYNQDWLNYQYEIARRHHRVAKNRTDAATGPDHIPARYVLGLLYPVTATLKPFLENSDYSPEEIDAMHQAWIKSVLMQVILWSEPYMNRGDF